MNMLLHGVENPDIRYRDSLAQDHAGEEEKYTLVLANPPFAGSARLREHRQGPAADRQDQEDRAALPRAVPAAAQARRTRRGHRARRRAVRLVQGAQGRCAGCWSRTRSSTPWSRCPAACSSPTPASPPRSCSSPRPTPAAPTTSGSTTCDADGWSLDDKRTPLLPRGQARPRARRPRSRADEHAKNNLPDVLARWAAARRRRARAPAHRAELLRAQGRHRRAGLRPLAQPLQGSRARGGRAPPAEGDPRQPRQTGGGDSAGDEGAGGDAEVKVELAHVRCRRSRRRMSQFRPSFEDSPTNELR